MMGKNWSRSKHGLRRVVKADFDRDPARFEFRTRDAAAPLCPYGNRYAWIGFDREAGEYVRFTKSIVRDGRLRRVDLGV